VLSNQLTRDVRAAFAALRHALQFFALVDFASDQNTFEQWSSGRVALELYIVPQHIECTAQRLPFDKALISSMAAFGEAIDRLKQSWWSVPHMEASAAKFPFGPNAPTKMRTTLLLGRSSFPQPAHRIGIVIPVRRYRCKTNHAITEAHYHQKSE
jgi:hypothetical protein